MPNKIANIQNFVQTDSLTHMEPQVFHLGYVGLFVNLVNDEFAEFVAEPTLLYEKSIYKIIVPEGYSSVSDPDNKVGVEDFIAPAYDPTDTNYVPEKDYTNALYDTPNPKFAWEKVELGGDVEHLLNRERNDMLNWLNDKTSTRLTYFADQVYSEDDEPDEPMHYTVALNEDRSKTEGKKVYDITLNAQIPIVDSGCTLSKYEYMPTKAEVDSTVKELGSYILVVKDWDDTDPTAPTYTPVKAIYSVDEYISYLDHGSNPVDEDDHSGPSDEESLIKVSNSIYNRAASGETRVIYYVEDDEETYDIHDRALTFRFNEAKIVFKGFTLGAKESIVKFTDTRYFDAASGIFISSFTGCFKDIFRDTVKFTVSQKIITPATETTPAVTDPFNYDFKIEFTTELDYKYFTEHDTFIKFTDTTDNKQGKEELADSLPVTEVGIYHDDYAGTQHVDTYKMGDTKSTISDLEYALEAAALNVKVNRNLLDSFIKDIIASITYIADDTIYFKSERQFLLYQAGKEGFHTDEYHKLVVDPESAKDTNTITVKIPNNELIFWKGKMYQFRDDESVDFYTITINFGEEVEDESGTLVPKWKHSSIVTGEDFYVIDWPCPLSLNDPDSYPVWWEVTVEEYLKNYTDYTASSWDDSVFKAVAMVLDGKLDEPFYEPEEPVQLFTKDAVTIEDGATVIDGEIDTYKVFYRDASGVSHELTTATIPDEAVSLYATGYVVKTKYSDGVLNIIYKLPLNKNMNEKVIYTRVGSDRSQDYIRDDFVFGVIPRCNAGYDHIDGIQYPRGGRIDFYPIAGVGMFQYGAIGKVELDGNYDNRIYYEPYCDKRVYDSTGAIVKELSEGYLEYEFTIYEDKQMISLANKMAEKWATVPDAAKDAMCASLHKLTFSCSMFNVGAKNSKVIWDTYKLSAGWSIVGMPEIYTDDREATLDLEFKFTPYDPDTAPATLARYEYTNQVGVGFPTPEGLKRDFVITTGSEKFPVESMMTNNEGTLTLKENIQNFKWSVTYRYTPQPTDYEYLLMLPLQTDSAGTKYDMESENPEFFNLLLGNVKSIRIEQ